MTAPVRTDPTRDRQKPASVGARLAVPGPGLPSIMGILNVTPDSFSDGGCFNQLPTALEHARRMVAEGTNIIDVGGESTRPGAMPASVDEELDRVVPVIEAIGDELPVAISIDTSKPEVMRAAVSAGASMINDVRALREEGAVAAAAELDVSVCLMHMQGEPRTMQSNPHYDDVVTEVRDFLVARAEVCKRRGIAGSRLLIDPGFGFGKSLDHNLRLLAELEVLTATGYPVVVGLSRKSMIGAILDRDVGSRVYGSVALGLMAYLRGAQVIRVHDVGATLDALRVAGRVAAVSQ